MILGLFRRDDPAPRALYAAIVAQSRLPAFYSDYGVPDTVEGRFDMIVLHLALLFRRLIGESGAGTIGQDVFDLFCRDMDHNLREMGVSDLAVPRKMRGFAEAFYGRLDVYARVLSEPGGPDLADALARNVMGAAEISAGARRLAAYMRVAAVRLDDTGWESISRGELTFPDPDTIPPRPEE